jgi:hypothetical protein
MEKTLPDFNSKYSTARKQLIRSIAISETLFLILRKKRIVARETIRPFLYEHWKSLFLFAMTFFFFSDKLMAFFMRLRRLSPT